MNVPCHRGLWDDREELIERFYSPVYNGTMHLPVSLVLCHMQINGAVVLGDYVFVCFLDTKCMGGRCGNLTWKGASRQLKSTLKGLPLAF